MKGDIVDSEAPDGAHPIDRAFGPNPVRTAFALASYHYQYLSQGGRDQSPTRALVSETRKIIIDECHRGGLLEKKGKMFRLRKLGALGSDARLNFADATRVLSLDRSPLLSEGGVETKLLRLAVSLTENREEVEEVLPRVFMYDDIPTQLRVDSKRDGVTTKVIRSNTLVGIMTRWMNEDPISEVVVNTPRFEIYESGLLTSARAISRNLNVIAPAIELARERDFTTTNPTTLGQYIETARNLATRI